MSEITRIVDAIQRGDPRAGEELLPLVYEELRRLAAHKMAHEAPGQTLQPTALVHEAWLRLAGSGEQGWNSRSPVSREQSRTIRACTLSFFDKYLKVEDDHLLDNPAAVYPNIINFRRK